MAGQNYERLGIEAFGQHLLDSNDLDPVYVALATMREEGRVSDKRLARWLVSYWMWYDCGVASWQCEVDGKAFWARLYEAARNEEPTPFGGRWRRASERRHMRGEQAVAAVNHLRERYEDHPHRMVEQLKQPGDAGRVINAAKSHRGFGPWISFKIADMVDRVLGIPLNFEDAHVFMFKDPVKAAAILWEEHKSLPRGSVKALKPSTLHSIVEHLKGMFSGYQAPPLMDRPVGLQEVETILCCWKSHLNGHYPLFNDQDEINHQIQPWLSHSGTAKNFYECMPKRPEE